MVSAVEEQGLGSAGRRGGESKTGCVSVPTTVEERQVDLVPSYSSRK